MAAPVPIFRDRKEVYRADDCRPLAEAAERHEVKFHAMAHGHYPGVRLDTSALPGLNTVGFWDAEQPQIWGLPWHRNEGLEITLLERGSLFFSVDGSEWRLGPDDLTVTRPWQRHRVGNPNVGAGRLHWVIIDVGVRRPNQNWRWPEWLVLSQSDCIELTNILRHCEQPVWKGAAELRRCFHNIAQTIESDTGGRNLSLLTVRINELFVLLLHLLRKRDTVLDTSLSSTVRTVELFLNDLRDHPENCGLDWTVPQMAASCGLGTTQFVDYVRRLTNVTPLHFLNDCRLRYAASLLRTREFATVTDIALQAGFSSSQYFATVFARRFGCPPSEYRLPVRRVAAAG